MNESGESLQPQSRREYFLEKLAQYGRLEVGALAAELGIAEETVRRDFRRLEKEGKLRRAHGGALPLESEVQFVENLGKPRVVPTELSKVAATMLPEAGWIFLDGGTNVEGAAGLIPESARFSVVAGSVGCALSASTRKGVSVVSLGGAAAGERGIYTGAWALKNLQNYFFDVCFLEVQGIASSGELLTADVSEAAVRRTVLERSGRRVAVWDGKNLSAAKVSFGHLGTIDTLVVPENTEIEQLREITELPNLVYAGASPAQTLL